MATKEKTKKKSSKSDSGKAELRAYCFKCQESRVLKKDAEVILLTNGRKRASGKGKGCPDTCGNLSGFVAASIPHDRKQTDEETKAAKDKKKGRKDSFLKKEDTEAKSKDKIKSAKKSKKSEDKVEKKIKKKKSKK